MGLASRGDRGPGRVPGRRRPWRSLAWLQAGILTLGALVQAGDGGEPTPLAAAVRARVELAIAAGELPGAVVVAGVVEGADERRLVLEVVGRRALEPEPEALDADTLFDLASLTKPLATASAVALLAERGALSLDEPVATYLPAFAAAGKQRVTVRDLLLHRGGLAPADGLENYRAGPDPALERILADAPRGEPGTSFAYSDLGYIVLGELVRAVDGRDLDAFWRAEFAAPLGLVRAGFRPAPELHPRCAPTERTTPEGPFLRGVVHDPRARALGGVAGHAGLFAAAEDVARWCRMVLGGGVLDGRRVLARSTVHEMLAPTWLPDGSGGRTLAFDVDTPYASARGRRFPRGRSLGHTGFTGTSLWLDPGSGAYLVILASRVHPAGEGRVLELRRDLATLVAEAVLGPRGAEIAPPPGAAPASRAPGPAEAPRASVRCGVDVLVEEGFARLCGRRVALLTNRTGVDRAGRRTIDLLHAAPGVELVRILSPEHGLAADLEGEVGHGRDPATGLAVFSLYGATRRPTDAMLAGLDDVLFDVQDAGVRIYTYATTLGYLMEECGRRGVRVVVLDRPDPLGGLVVDGPRADPDRLAFISYRPIPFVHGLTVGELARLFRGRYGVACELDVVPLAGWSRGMLFEDTDLEWIAPSPNLRTPTQALLYSALGLLEAANLSVGRGTDAPFERLGAPWIDGELLAAALEGAGLPGVRFAPLAFTPSDAVFAGQRCSGVALTLTDPRAFEGPRTGFTIAWWLERLFAADLEVARLLDRARSYGAWRALRLASDPASIPAVWAQDVASFHAERAPYLLYD